MTSTSKLLRAVAENPEAVRFVSACKIAEVLGFIHKGGAGSHHAFARPGVLQLLNFQNRRGYIPPYQARQLIAMIAKYGVVQ